MPIHLKEFIVLILTIKSWGGFWAGHRIVMYCDDDSVCDTCTHQRPKDLKMQELLREFLFWVCKYNFFLIVEKIETKENHIADYLSRVYDSDLIDKYLTSEGFDNSSCVDIPLSWYEFQADW